MTAALVTRAYHDGRGEENDLQDLDLSGTGAGPFVRAAVLLDATGTPYSAGGGGSSNGALETGGNLAAVAAAAGTTADAAYAGSGSTSIVSALKGAYVKLAAILTALGNPFQAGGSIGNTAFGISGTLPAFAAAPTVNVGTSTLALETGGNLAAVAAAAGATADAAYAGSGSSSIVSALKGAYAKLAAILTALGNPFQAGGSIANTVFGATQSGTWSTTGAGASGAAVAGNPVLVAGSDGTNARTLLTDTTGGVIPGDAAAITVTPASSAAVLFSQDTKGYNSVSVQITGAGTSCTVTYEASDDNTNWTVAAGLNASSSTVSYPSSTTSTSLLTFPAVHRYFRARVSTYGSGTVTAVAYLRTAQVVIPNTVTTNSLLTASALTNSISIGVAIAPATPASVSIKGSTGRLYSITAGNSGTTDVWVKVFNNGSVTLGTTSATFNLYVPKGTTQTLSLSDLGIYFSSTIIYAVTGGISLTDNTSITANTVSVNYLYQ